MQPLKPLLPLLTMPFIQAQNYTKANRKEIRWVVIHSAEGLEKSDKAENMALWFAGKAKEPAPRTSAHYAVDCDSIVQMVRDVDVAWHAPGANRFGIGIEHAGKAKQTDLEWFDEFSKPMLELSVVLTAKLCARWIIPPVFVDAAGLLQNKHGITTHAEVTKAFKKSTHTDPGKNFPLAWYVDEVRKLLG